MVETNIMTGTWTNIYMSYLIKKLEIFYTHTQSIREFFIKTGRV